MQRRNAHGCLQAWCGSASAPDQSNAHLRGLGAVLSLSRVVIRENFGGDRIPRSAASAFISGDQTSLRKPSGLFSSMTRAVATAITRTLSRRASGDRQAGRDTREGARIPGKRIA
jgi:hypothetical protein